MSAPLPPKDSFVPPIITTTTTSKSSISDDNSRDFVEFTASIDDILQGHANAKQHTTTSAYAVDDSITEDTLSIDYDTELEYSIADDDDDDDIGHILILTVVIVIFQEDQLIQQAYI